MKRRLVLISAAWLVGACGSDGGGGGSAAPGEFGGAGAMLPPDGNAGGASAGSSGTTNPDAPPLTIESITPADEASDVELDAVIEVRFSAPLDPATATASNVVVQGPNGAIEGDLTVAGDVVRFAPAAPLPLLTPVRVSLSTALKSAEGRALAAAVEAQFQSRDGVFRDPVQINAGAASGLFLRGNDSGDLIATWTDLQVRSNVEGMVFDGDAGAWTTAQLIENDDQLAFTQPVAAVAPNGDSIVTWRGGGWARYSGSWAAATIAQGVAFPNLALADAAALSATNTMGNASFQLLPSGASAWSEAQPLLMGGRVEAVDTLDGGFIAVGTRNGALVAGQLAEPTGAWSEFTSLAEMQQVDQLRLATRGDAAAVAWVDRREVPATETQELSFVSRAATRVFAEDAWAPALELPEGADLPWVSVAEGGRALAVWTQVDAVSVSSFSADQGWTEPQQLAEQSQLVPAGAVDGNGNFMAVWPSNEQIAVRRQASGGQWQALEAIDSQVTVALWSHVDGQGRVSLVWQNGNGIWWTRFE
ncbi:MAG TPA: Ig-like domain-containing protein [Polyangiaceae bacterium]|nr:Ig-like domain-containing protein [Polyangiaceae bacterium]